MLADHPVGMTGYCRPEEGGAPTMGAPWSEILEMSTHRSNKCLVPSETGGDAAPLLSHDS